LEGRLVHSVYEKDGQKRYSTDVVLNSFELVEAPAEVAEVAEAA